MTDTAVTATDPEDVASPIKHDSYVNLNAQLNFWSDDHKIQYDKDREAVRRYFLDNVNPNTVFFHSLEEKLDYLVKEDYYEAGFLEKYDITFIKNLYKKVYAHKFRFPTFVGAFKFYGSYALKTFNGQRFLERFEDRIAATALYLGDGNKKLAEHIAEEIITGRFQPATPTFLNSGKAQRGDLVSCYLIDVADDLNSIGRAINSSLQLSKRGGGVALNLTNIRAKGDPIKKIENQSSGVIPVMKLLEDSFSYANQLGARQGAGAVYLNAHHIDIMDFLDTKRENADEKVRIKTLSLGVVIPDITFELAKNKEPMYLFSPYDLEKVYGKEMAELTISDIYREAVDNADIRKKKIDPREFLSTIAEIQMESGYPYILFEDAANRANNVPGRIKMSNLCSEILQPQEPSFINDGQQYENLGKDISCNLASLNILAALQSTDLARTVETAIRTLTQVSDFSDVESVPTIQAGNRRSHAIGLGAMNLHGAFGHYHMFYGDEESLDLTNMYFYVVTYHAIRSSMLIAKEKGEFFDGFKESTYASGEYFERFINPTVAVAPVTDKVAGIFKENEIFIPTAEDWEKLAAQVKKHGMYNQNLQAVPPTGSISYINNSTSSIHPAVALIEARKEGKMGTVYVPASGFEGNEEFFEDAYDVGPFKLVDIYSLAQYYCDQGLSLTTFYPDTATTRDINKGVLYAFSKGKVSSKEPDERQKMLAQFPQGEIKTMYYIRLKQSTLDGASNYEECVSCTL